MRCLYFIFAAGIIYGEPRSAAVTGVVSDAAGAPVRGAEVMIKSPAGGALQFSATSRVDGGFTFKGVKAATYELCIGARGFKTSCRTLTVTHGEKKSLGTLTVAIDGCCGGVDVGPPPSK